MQQLSVIEDVVNLLSASHLPRGSQVRLSLQGLDASRARAVEFALNKSLGECGCRMSAAFLCFAVSLALIVDAVAWRTLSHHWMVLSLVELVLIFLCAAIGRALALLSARQDFRRAIAALVAELQP